jgi:hypothetical protein
MSDLAARLRTIFEEDGVAIGSDVDRYFKGAERDRFTGRWFERWAALGDPNHFGATDILAVETLSVTVPPEAAADLVLTRSDEFDDLLAQLPAEKVLWDVPEAVVSDGGFADQLHQLLKDLPGVGWVTAGKLMAAKRPALIPVYDARIKAVLNPAGGPFWLPLQEALRDESLRALIEETTSMAPDGVALLRRLDVALWMYGGRAHA